MIFTSVYDFLGKAGNAVRLTRPEEKEFFVKMKAGDMTARDKIIVGYLYVVAAKIKRLPKSMQSLDMVYRCVNVLEKAVDKFDFLQESETFMHRLCVVLQQEFIR